MFQSNQAAEALDRYYSVPRWITRLVLAVLVGAVIIGGIRRIGRVAARIVPLMFLVYLSGALLICLFNLERVPLVRLGIVPLTADARGWIDRVEPIGEVEGIALTIASFDALLPGFGSWFVSLVGLLFAFSTMVTWSYYGETAARFLAGRRVLLPYKVVFVALVLVGAVQRLDVVLNLSDVLIGLLVVPNAIALLLLSEQTARLTRAYFEQLRRGFPAGPASRGP